MTLAFATVAGTAPAAGPPSAVGSPLSAARRVSAVTMRTGGSLVPVPPDPAAAAKHWSSNDEAQPVSSQVPMTVAMQVRVPRVAAVTSVRPAAFV